MSESEGSQIGSDEEGEKKIPMVEIKEGIAEDEFYPEDWITGYPDPSPIDRKYIKF